MTEIDEKYLIRRALIVDAPGIARAHVQAWRESYRGLVPADLLAGLSVERRAVSHAARLSQPNDEQPTFVAVEPGYGVVGFGICGRRRSGPGGYLGEFQALYIIERAKGQGLGRQLMLRMAAWLHGQGFVSAVVLVLKDNHPARRFYERLGGVLCHEAPFTLDGARLVEVGYGWGDVRVILPRPPGAEPIRLPTRDD